jgi:hypothetical protein
MARTGNVDLMQRELNAIAWEFLGSKFTGQTYRGWPIDRRLSAYLTHRGLTAVANDGGICNVLLDRIMANMGHALRSGILNSNGARA